MLAGVSAAFGFARLILAIDALFHAPEQESRGVAGEKRIPIASPDNLDYVPSCSAEDAFELVDDLAVPAHRAVEPLQVAVHNEDQVIELLACGNRQRTESFDFIGFAIAYERPNLARRFLDQIAMFEISHEARLIDRIDRADAHRDCGELPKIRHQPRMRIGGESRLASGFVAEVQNLLLGDTSF